MVDQSYVTAEKKKKRKKIVKDPNEKAVVKQEGRTEDGDKNTEEELPKAPFTGAEHAERSMVTSHSSPIIPPPTHPPPAMVLTPRPGPGACLDPDQALLCWGPRLAP
ncbi:unnamed protein product [Boreogadus saida]